jgi:hypothetical protein
MSNVKLHAVVEIIPMDTRDCLEFIMIARNCPSCTGQVP